MTEPPAAIPSEAQSPFDTGGESSTERTEPPIAEQVPLSPISPPWELFQTTLDRLTAMFEARLHHDKTKDEAFERLYSELDSLRRNDASQRLKPLYLDLILLFDRIEQICAAQTDPAITDLLGTIRDELLEILYRRDVAPISSAGTAFDSSLQQAIGTEPAASTAENNAVARVVRRGFRYEERILRPEEVVVKRYRQETRT
jgi:molecular chaperone GrpE (heat shock protein)